MKVEFKDIDSYITTFPENVHVLKENLKKAKAKPLKTK